jgi:DNA-binding CsgD family transcriptional regulator
MIKLSDKEKRFIELKSHGLKMNEIARILFMSEATLEKFAKGIYEKTGTVNGSSLIRWGYENGILKINTENLPEDESKVA